MSTPIFTDRNVTLPGDDTVYLVGEVIDPGTPLVAHWRKVVSETLDIDGLVAEMVRTAKLLNVGHLASADYPKIQNSVWLVLSHYQKAVGKTELTLGEFSMKSETVLNNLMDAFDALANGRFHRCVQLVKRCENAARTLADKADDIAGDFDGLVTDSEAIVTAAQDRTDIDQQKIRALEHDVADMKADYAEQKSLSEAYASQKEKVQKLYNEALADARTAEQHAFIAEIVGGVASALGAGLAAYASASTPRINVGGTAVAPTQQTSDPLPPAPASEDAEQRIGEIDISDDTTVGAGEDDGMEDAADETGDTGTIGAGEDDDMEDAADGNDEDDTPETLKVDEDEETDAEKQAEADATRQKKTDDSVKGVGDDTRAKVKGIGAGLEQAGKNASGFADKAQSAAVALRREVGQLLDLQFSLEEKRITALAKLARYAVVMKQDIAQISTVQITVASLAQAIGAMQSAKSTFEKLARYWRGMEEACNQLGSDNDFAQNIHNLDTIGASDDEADFLDRNFKRSAVDYCAGWTALHQIATESRTAMVGLGDEVAKYVSAHPEESAARAEATRLAADLGLDVGKAQKAIEDKAARTKDLRDLLTGETDTEEKDAA